MCGRGIGNRSGAGRNSTVDFWVIFKGLHVFTDKKTLGGKWCKNGNRQNGMECKCNPADAKEWEI